MPPITGQSILIIGGSSGIGFGVAMLALSSGAGRIFIASSNSARFTTAVNKLKSLYPNAKVSGHQYDLLHPDVENNLQKLLIEVTTEGLLDHIIFTAVPAVTPTSLKDASLAYIQSTFQPFFSTILLAKLAPQFVKPGYTSSIILTSGQVAEKPAPNYSIYASYAAGLYGLVRSLALDLAPLRFNLVSPGATDTELWGKNRDMIREAVKGRALLGKPGSADEVAEAYIYLMRDTNATGSRVSTSGGSLLQ